MKHCISIHDIDDLGNGEFFRTVDIIRSNQIDFMQEMHNRLLCNLFYEPSTRTSSSFAAAMYKLGGQVLSINDVNYSSVAKGENLEDTILTLGEYCNIIVLRSKNAGDAEKASSISNVPIINAGDGSGEHPTQTLLDLYTIFKQFGRVYNLKVAFIGDNKNSRTVHSLNDALERWCEIFYIDDYDLSKIPQADVYYFTRVQRERGSTGSYELTKEHIDLLPDNCIVMHPFPRNEEIPRWFDSDPRAKYFEQIKNGLFVRMALLKTINSTL